MTLKDDFSDFGETFQEKLAWLILLDRPFSEQIEEVLEFDFFELKHLKTFVEMIFNHRATYKVHPSVNTMIMLIKTELDESDSLIVEKVTDFMNRMHEEENIEAEFIKDNSLDFCKKQKLKTAMFKSIDLLQNSKFSEVKTIIDQALKLGSDTNFGHDFALDFEERYLPKFRSPISTGWSAIDKITGGGLGKKELSVVVASSGGGKSWCLCQAGVAALLEGKTVVHYTLELSDAVVGKRYDAMISKIPLSDLNNSKDYVKEKVSEVPGNLIIKEYSSNEADVNVLRNHISRLNSRRERPVDLVIVDYADLLKPIRQYEQRRTELGAVYQALRDMGKEFNCPVATASQSNRTGAKESIITMEAIAEAYEKCFVADFVYTVSRTMEDRQMNQGKFFIAKNRNGPDGQIFQAQIDLSRGKINVLEKKMDWDSASRGADTNQKKKLYKATQKYMETLKIKEDTK
jgi:replicative DNA helicase